MATNTPNLSLPKPALSDRVADTIGTDLPKAFGILDGLMPVGIIWMFSKDVNPNTLFPGTTWTQLHNVFLVASGSQFPAGSTGGASTHRHTTPFGFDGSTNFFHHDPSGNPAYGSQTLVDNVYTSAVEYNQVGNLREAFTDTTSNLPPYKAVYMWERTS